MALTMQEKEAIVNTVRRLMSSGDRCFIRASIAGRPVVTNPMPAEEALYAVRTMFEFDAERVSIERYER